MSEEHEEALIDCDTSAGMFSLELHKDWSPLGYERAVALFERGWYDDSHFFRVVPNFLVQFGMSYTLDPELRKFAESTISDDPKLNPPMPFKEGVVSFAGSGPNSRTSQLFISYGSNPNLGRELWETPIGTVIDGMDAIRQFNSEYGDMPPWGKGPVQNMISKKGSSYIETEYPHLDKFINCEVERVYPNDIEKEELERGIGLETDDAEDPGADDEAKGVSADDDQPPTVEGNPNANGNVRVGRKIGLNNPKTLSEVGENVQNFLEKDNVKKVTHNVAFPVGVALVVFAFLMFIMRRGDKKKSEKKN